MRPARDFCRFVIACLFTLTPFVGCSPQTLPESEWPSLRIGYLPIAAQLPLFVAVGEGYFEDEGLRVELTQLPSSNELANAATADRVDLLAGAALNVVFDSGETSGKRHKLFAINPYSDRPGFVTDHLIVASGSDISNVTSLEGKRIASFPGSVIVLVYLVLEDYGLERDEYESIQMLPKDWQPSLQSGAVDAVVALEPSATQMIKDGVGRSILPGFYAKLMEDMPLSGHWFATDFLARADADQLSAIMRVYERAIAFCSESPDRAKSYLVDYANVREDILEAVNLNPWTMFTPQVSANVRTYSELLADNGGLSQRPELDEYLFEPASRNDH